MKHARRNLEKDGKRDDSGSASVRERKTEPEGESGSIPGIKATVIADETAWLHGEYQQTMSLSPPGFPFLHKERADMRIKHQCRHYCWEFPP